MSMSLSAKNVFWLSVVAMIAVLAASLRLGEAIDFRHTILSDERAGTLVRIGSTQVEWTAFMFERVLPEQLNIVDYTLVTTRTTTLWGFIYLLGGLAGGIATLWLAAAGIRRAHSLPRERVLPQLASSAVAGVLIFLILRLPSAMISRFIAISTDTARSDTLFEQCILLAVLAGLFASAFFVQIEKSFRLLLRSKPVDGKE